MIILNMKAWGVLTRVLNIKRWTMINFSRVLKKDIQNKLMKYINQSNVKYRLGQRRAG
jgi:hypothetical protein